jgi:hypothetical protein
MLRAEYHSTEKELLVAGLRSDYARLSHTTQQALDSGVEAELPVESTGPTLITHFVVRRAAPPIRVSVEGSRVIFSVASTLHRQFISFIEFPDDADLPDSPIQYHHHFDGLADDGTHVAADSLPVVFGLERT